MVNSILKLDGSFQPVGWIDFEKAANYLAKDMVLWNSGENTVLHGGYNHQGIQSIFELPSIMAVKGKIAQGKFRQTIGFSKSAMILRDHNMCAYCGSVCRTSELEVEHIMPESRGGATSFKNTVSACRTCNALKADRTPEEAKMPLLYVPYEPNIHEGLILSRRSIKADQMEFLLQGVPKHSRIRQGLEIRLN